MPNPLDAHRRNVTSQCGEDGLIEHLLTLLPATPKTCLEVGAGDGISLSNTNTLWSKQGWRALLIEGVPLGVEMIEKRAAGNANVTAVCAYISATGENSIDAIIARANFPAHLGVLSLDIDSNDLEVLENLRAVTATSSSSNSTTRFRPRSTIAICPATSSSAIRRRRSIVWQRRRAIA